MTVGELGLKVGRGRRSSTRSGTGAGVFAVEGGPIYLTKASAGGLVPTRMTSPSSSCAASTIEKPIWTYVSWTR
jgi:hypothetical protein